MAQVGRPRKKFSKEQFEKLCILQCTESEICGFFGTSDKTLNKWLHEVYQMNFSECFKEFSQDGLISLRRSQFKLAERSPAMAIWLGKQYLGQKEQQEVTIDTANVDDTIKKMNAFFAGGENA